MGYACKILKDSISPDNIRLTSMEITFPRISLPQMLTHRVFSRNTASTRAIPVKKMIEQVITNPYIPHEWGTAQKGMVSGPPLIGKEAELSEKDWLEARDNAVMSAQMLLDKNIHKELANQLMIPWMWTTMIITGTEWDNLLNLRTNFDVGKPILPIALMMRDARNNSTPGFVNYGEWHRPYITEEDLQAPISYNLITDQCLNEISIGRCGRVSYLTHDGIRDRNKDIDLTCRLLYDRHMSPFEHVARPMEDGDVGLTKCILGKSIHDTGIKDVYHKPSPVDTWSGNLRGWVSYRKLIPNEDVFRPELVNNG